MKQFIVLTAILPIMMALIMQTGQDQKNNLAINIIHDMVYVAKEKAKDEGRFTWEIQDRLRQDLSRLLKVPEEEVVIYCREEGDILFYRIEVPIKNVVAGNRLFGISDNENQYMYVIDSYTIARKSDVINDGNVGGGGDDVGGDDGAN